MWAKVWYTMRPFKLKRYFFMKHKTVTKSRIVKLLERRKTPATAKNIASRTNSNYHTVRNVLGKLISEGVVSRKTGSVVWEGRTVSGYSLNS